ncbi:MAG: DUF5615 family PIN-like protein [Burkholderiales bacterium]|nr:DUF5615 family PIN-like protein [Phycisphaerae bacterium]
MLFKTDENLHPDAAQLLRDYGHDALTIWDQQMRGAIDRKIADICASERRALVTLDLDFADIRTYPPREYSGLIVLRLNDQSRRGVVAAINRFLPLLNSEPIIGALWIVEENRIRVRNTD